MSSYVMTAPERGSITAGGASHRSPEAARRIQRLQRLTEVRHARWLRLYSEPDVWTDSVKRRQMLRARWQYQRAVIFCLMVSRQD
jgi:hypothetical protein